MTVWKSPILYLGILLIAVVLAALAAPFVISWDGYRADLENYGRKLTGREVTIAGPISARLFPWPRLTLADVHVANLPGLEGKDFASAARVELRMRLGGLFSGTIQVESIDIAHPVVAFERTTAGQSNWQLESTESEATALLGRVKLDQIRLSDGIVRFIDRRRGGVVQLDSFNADLAAPGVAGPWRLRGLGLYRGQGLEVSLNTGSQQAGEPLRFALRVAHADASGLIYGFDGSAEDGRVTGQARIEPAASGEAKGDPEGRLRPLVATAKVDASFEEIALNDIQIAPQDTTEGGTLVSGNARLTLGQHMAAKLVLEAPRIDLDEIAGAKARQLFREGQGLALFSQAMAQLPPDVSLDASFKLTTLKAGGETLENVAVALTGTPEQITLSRVYAGLPGRSAILLSDAMLLPGATGPELNGTLSLDTSDARALAVWLWPEAQTTVDTLWRGSRGRLKGEANLSYQAGRIQLTRARYELDGMAGSADLAVIAGAPQAVEVRLAADTLDLDNLLGPAQGNAAAALASELLPSEARADLRLAISAGRLLLNGVEAQDVTVDLASSAKGLDLRNLKVGAAGGARLQASGLVLESGGGNEGAIDVTLAAEDPRGALRLAGLIPRDREPAWTAGLGKTDMKARLTLKPGAKGIAGAVELNGTTGSIAVAASGDMTGEALQGSIELNSATAEPLAALVGFVPAAADQSPAHVVVTASGSAAQGFLADLQVQAFAAQFEYTGKVTGTGGLDGKASLRTTSATPLFAALGLPVASLPSGNLVLDATVAPTTDKPLTLAIEGRLDETPLTASLARDAAGMINGTVDTGPLVLRDVLAAALLAWNGGAAEADSPFAAALPFGLEGELWITPRSLAISDSYMARDVQIVITSAAGEIHFELYGKDEQGRDAKISLTTRQGEAEGTRAADGKVVLPINLASQLRLASGEAVADGEGLIDVTFAGEGRSPGGVLAALTGSGNVQVKNLSVLDINPEGFTAALGDAADTAAIVAAFAALRKGGGLGFGDVAGALAIDHGEATLAPFTMSSAAADATLKVLADLALGRIDAALTLVLHGEPARPPMDIVFAGPPAALARAEDKAALFGQLGVAVMDKGVAELERLRQEQERLAAQEAQARVQDEEKLQDYYAQRDELRARQRELKVHAAARQQQADALRASIEAERGANIEINKDEMKQRLRALKLYRRLAKSDGMIEVALPAKQKPRIVSPPALPRPLSPPRPPVPPAPLGIPDLLQFPPVSPSQ